jgi:AraC family transcriptional regulator, regulatory protein of adaptative response / methylated-DNA-[protein]-cysteine methyltransferase
LRNIRVAGAAITPYVGCKEPIMTDQSPAYHYTVIARALHVIDASGPDLTLDALAAQMQMSPHHFQRTFSQWVGVSPKRYQQYLTLDHAKRLLADRFTLLETTLSTGLSGASRLHDLFVTWEAMTPGDYARGGAGLTITYGHCDTPFGEALVMATDRGLCGLAFAADMGRDAAMADLVSRWPKATFVVGDITRVVASIFGGAGTIPLHLIGAPFQIKVWEALLRIPSGHVTTYGEIGRAIGQPLAVRAVGTAVGRNPLAFIIPCHRAIRKTGGLGGYHWGLPVKRAMLAWEGARADAD